MIEVILVIVVLGIVSSIGASIIAQAYESYLLSRSQYRANIKTEQVLDQIANRLRYAIPGTVGARVTKGGTFLPITSITSTAQRNVLQWVGEDGDSFEAVSGSGSSGTARRPGWSGFIDLNQSTKTSLVSPGSNFDLTNSIIQHLSGGSKSLSSARIFFPPQATHPSIPVTSGSGGESLSVSGLSPGDTITERYKLGWSSYAVVFENGSLWLYYNFSPTKGVSLDGAVKSKLLANVTSFSFKGSEGSMWIKVCQYEPFAAGATSSSDSNVSKSCKEKIVLY